MREHLGLSFVIFFSGIGVFFTAPLTGFAFALVMGSYLSLVGLWMIWEALK